MAKYNFPILGLQELKVGSNASINNIPLARYTFCYGETNDTSDSTVFYIRKCSYISHDDFNNFLHNSLEYTFRKYRPISSLLIFNKGYEKSHTGEEDGHTSELLFGIY